jgi:hypothetical protein
MLRLFWRGACPSFLIEPAGPALHQEPTAAVLASQPGSCLHRIQEVPVSELSEPILKLLDETLDIDVREMTPSHLGLDIVHKIFRTNSELLLPSLSTLTGEPVFR